MHGFRSYLGREIKGLIKVQHENKSMKVKKYLVLNIAFGYILLRQTMLTLHVETL